MDEADVADQLPMATEYPFAGEMAMNDFEHRLSRLEGQVSQNNVEIAKLVESIEGYRGNQEQLMAMMQRMLNRHDEQLNGFQDKPGMMVRVDRMEQREQARTWHIRTLWAAFLATVGAWLVKR